VSKASPSAERHAAAQAVYLLQLLHAVAWKRRGQRLHSASQLAGNDVFAAVSIQNANAMVMTIAIATIAYIENRQDLHCDVFQQFVVSKALLLLLLLLLLLKIVFHIKLTAFAVVPKQTLRPPVTYKA
jgi:hypothetical protein